MTIVYRGIELEVVDVRIERTEPQDGEPVVVTLNGELVAIRLRPTTLDRGEGD